MSDNRKLLIDDRTVGNTLAAVIEDGRLVEFYTERTFGLVGAVFVGRVKDVTKAGFAFVDIGRDKPAFVPLGDAKEKDTRLKQGETVIIRIVKDETGNKGCYATTKMTAAGSLVAVTEAVYSSVSLSAKITDESERARLRGVLESSAPKGFSVVARTKAQHAEAGEIAAEIERLVGDIATIRERGKGVVPPQMLSAADFKNEIISESGDCEVLYENEGGSLFYAYNVGRDLREALNPRVWLKSGAYLVIEKTEACWVVDVNTGKFGGKKNANETAFAVNKEAAAEVARQIRLRNASGIIIIDFIGMDSEDHKTAIIETLKTATAQDRAGVVVHGLTALGLAELTRRKGRGALKERVKGINVKGF